MKSQHLYLNDQSVKNNRHFETAYEIIKYSTAQVEAIKAYKKEKGFLKNFNTKLGKNIFSFDLLAISSCPDSDSCFKECYANQGTFLFPSTKKSNTYNFAIALHDIDYLEAELKQEIVKKKIKNIRIHSSGDFYSREYFMMWLNIANHFPNVNIFTYSKAPQIDRSILPKNLNIINSFVKVADKEVLNFGSYNDMKALAQHPDVKGLLCPITKGNHFKKLGYSLKDSDPTKSKEYLAKAKKLQPPKFTCSVCKYCITKKKPTFVMH